MPDRKIFARANDKLHLISSNKGFSRLRFICKREEKLNSLLNFVRAAQISSVWWKRLFKAPPMGNIELR